MAVGIDLTLDCENATRLADFTVTAGRRRLVRFGGISGPFRLGGRPGTPLHLAVQDLIGDRLQGGADRARRDPLKGRAGGVDLGLGGVAGFGQGG